MNKILITGATGHLGSAVAKHLKTKISTEHLTVLVRNKDTETVKNYIDEGFDVRVADYDNYELLVEAFNAIDTLYFVSGSDIANRLSQHKNVVKAAKEAGIKHIVYTSTVRNDETENAPLFTVVDAHKQTEDAILASGLKYTILRHNLYAEVINLFLGDKNQILQSKTVYLPTEQGKTAFVVREDFAEAEALILANLEHHVNKIYEFNGSEAVSFETIATYLTEALNEPIQYVSPTVADFKNTLASFGLPEPIIDLTTSFSEGIANGEFNQTKNDLETILGRKTTPILDYIKQSFV